MPQCSETIMYKRSTKINATGECVGRITLKNDCLTNEKENNDASTSKKIKISTPSRKTLNTPTRSRKLRTLDDLGNSATGTTRGTNTCKLTVRWWENLLISSYKRDEI